VAAGAVTAGVSWAAGGRVTSGVTAGVAVSPVSGISGVGAPGVQAASPRTTIKIKGKTIFFALILFPLLVKDLTPASPPIQLL
jgi:hypothetical protein